MEKLLEVFRPYIAPHPDFDLVLSKFGPLYVYPVDRQGEMHEAEVLDGPKGIIEAVAFQMICDAIESGTRASPTKEELAAVRSRVLSCIPEEYAEIVERYIKQYENAVP
jgi:hypothetical protein